jgi:hypothetical protein
MEGLITMAPLTGLQAPMEASPLQVVVAGTTEGMETKIVIKIIRVEEVMASKPIQDRTTNPLTETMLLMLNPKAMGSLPPVTSQLITLMAISRTPSSPLEQMVMVSGVMMDGRIGKTRKIRRQNHSRNLSRTLVKINLSHSTKRKLLAKKRRQQTLLLPILNLRTLNYHITTKIIQRHRISRRLRLPVNL